MSKSQPGLSSVSPALITAFNEASSSTSTRALKITIQNESLEPDGTLTRESTAEEDFSKLNEWITDNKAAYVIYFIDSPKDHYIFISYVPDTVNVRSKMLYASTRATLMSTLGLRTQRLVTQLIATSNADLIFPSKDETVISLSNLSIREKELAEIKAAEAEGAQGTSKRVTLVSSSGVAFPFSNEAKNAITALAIGEGEELIQLYIEEETIELAAANKVSKGEEIVDIIFEDEPRFSFFLFIHDYKGSEVSSIVFIYSCPSSASIKNRMLYASSRQAVLTMVESLGIKVDAKVETSDINELTLRNLMKEIHVVEVVEEKKAFARPRGPPKRIQRTAATGTVNENQDAAPEN